MVWVLDELRGIVFILLVIDYCVCYGDFNYKNWLLFDC